LYRDTLGVEGADRRQSTRDRFGLEKMTLVDLAKPTQASTSLFAG
jgi:hypothetical protein